MFKNTLSFPRGPITPRRQSVTRPTPTRDPDGQTCNPSGRRAGDCPQWGQSAQQGIASHLHLGGFLAQDGELMTLRGAAMAQLQPDDAP